MARSESCESENLLFLRQWIRAPLRVASVVPSSPALARLITRDIGPETGPVLELGPGTGVFTRALVASGVAEERLTLVETDPRFAILLAGRFGRANIVAMDASKLNRSHVRDNQPFGAAVSGLPLLSMPHGLVRDILGAAFRLMAPGASLFQFTYGPRCPVPAPVRHELGLTFEKTGSTWRNFPPAAVYRISMGKQNPST